MATAASLALSASPALASGSFGSSPQLDDFTADTALSSSWTTPALGVDAMQLSQLSTVRDLSGTAYTWTAALWNVKPFSNPVEVRATVHRAGSGDATLYADVVNGGFAPPNHPTEGYFADFGGSTSGSFPDSVSVVRIVGPNDVTRLAYIGAPYHTDLQPGDQIGLSVTGGVITAWYKPSGSSSWTAVVSAVDRNPYTSGNIAIEAIPGPFYGYSNFGGGTPSTPVVSTPTNTSIGASADTIGVGKQVTYIATVSPAPHAPGGSLEFLDTDSRTVIPACKAQSINANGQATCTLSYSAAGIHHTGALYTGSPDGALAGSTNGPDARVVVRTPTRAQLSTSSTTPSAGRAVRYTTTVSPAPDGGSVAFTDNGRPIGACASVVLRKGAATCRVTYRDAGRHRISSSYGGDTNYEGSAGIPARNVTVSTRPGFKVQRRQLILTPVCPAQSGGCRITASVLVALPGAKRPIALAKLSHGVPAGRPGRFVFVLAGRAQSILDAYVRHHRTARLGVSVKLVIRDGDGSSGTQILAYTIRRARDLSLL